MKQFQNYMNRYRRYDFIVDFDPSTDDEKTLLKRIFYSAFIQRRIKKNKPAIIFISGDSGEGKSWLSLNFQEILGEVQGWSLLPNINVINVYTPIEYPEKLNRILNDPDCDKINIIVLHEARDVVKAKEWNTFVTQAIADINAQVRQVKRLIVIVISQFIRDITNDMRYTLNYYIKAERPVNNVKAEFWVMWKDDKDLQHPVLRKRRFYGYIRYPNNRLRKYVPHYFEFSRPPKEITEIFERNDLAAKKNIIRRKLEKIMIQMKLDMDVGNPKVDAMVSYYTENVENLEKIGKFKPATKMWVLNRDFKAMHDLTDTEGKEFAKKLYDKLKESKIIENKKAMIEREETGLEFPTEEGEGEAHYE